MPLKQVPIESILIENRLLNRKSKVVAALKASIAQCGLIQPPVVRKVRDGYRLKVGRHRVEACRQLGWKTVAVIVDEGSDDDELVQVEENLTRLELTATEKALLRTRRKAIYEAAHPETKKGGAPGKAGGGKKATTANLAGFAASDAAMSGDSERAIRRDVQRAAALGVHMLAKLKGTSLDKGVELDALMSVPIADRGPLVARAVAGEPVSAVAFLAEAARKADADARAKVTSLAEHRKPEPGPLTALLTAWDAAPEDVRDQFCRLKGLDHTDNGVSA